MAPCEAVEKFGEDRVSPGVLRKCQGKPAAEKPSHPPQPIPRDKWPAWAKLVATRAEPADVGVGATIERLAGSAGVAFKVMYKTLTGEDCGCAGRRERWNATYPYLSDLPSIHS
jgi:hypothetical protein